MAEYTEPTAGTAIGIARGSINQTLRTVLSSFYGYQSPTSANLMVDGVAFAVPDGALYRSSNTGVLYISDSINKKDAPVGGNFTRTGIAYRIEPSIVDLTANRNSYEIGEMALLYADSGGFNPYIATSLWVKTANTGAFPFTDIGRTKGYEWDFTTNYSNFTTNVTIDYNLTIGGTLSNPDGFSSFKRDSAVPVHIDRLTNDGNIVTFLRDAVQIGTITSASGVISYNPFLGAHLGAFSDWSRSAVYPGTIVETIDEPLDWKYITNENGKKVAYNGTKPVGSMVSFNVNNINYIGQLSLDNSIIDLNKHVKIKISDVPGSKAVFGVFLGWNNDTDTEDSIGIWNDCSIAAVGNYFVRMAPDQIPEIGDLVESNGDGCGKIQSDDMIRSKTVAKITSTTKHRIYPDGSFLVTAVIYCG